MSSNLENENISMLELEEALECVICLSVPPSTPIHQCDNGHLFCRNCRSRLIDCPICRKKLGIGRNLLAEKMLEKIPLRCPYSSLGCQVKISQKDVENHGQECHLREVCCPSRLCKQRVRFAVLMDHIFMDHSGLHFIFSKTEGSDTLAFQISEADFSKDQWWSPNHLNFMTETFFVLLARVDETRLWQCWIQGVGSKEEMSRFRCKIKMYGSEKKESVTYRGHVVSIDTDFETATSEQLGLSLSDKLVKRLWNNKEIKCDVYMFKLKVN